MKDAARDDLATASLDGISTSFSASFERDGIAVITATRHRTRRFSTRTDRPGPSADISGSHPLGAFVVEDSHVRWRPAVDVTRLLTTTEIVVGAVVVASRLARRPVAPTAHVTMGPGGWVSMKGGAVGVRPASRPWARPRRLSATVPPSQAPIWARVLSAVPLQALNR